MTRRAALIGLAALCAVGCGSSDELFPLSEGRRWSFLVQTGFPTFPNRMVVKRSLSVGGVKGYELEGPMGSCRLAWSGDKLIAGQMANTEFFPALPILRSGSASAPMAWKGRIRLYDGTLSDATAEQTQREETLNLQSRRVKTVVSTVNVLTNGHRIELITSYEPGRGPVRQIQRTDGRLIVAANGL